MNLVAGVVGALVGGLIGVAVAAVIAKIRGDRVTTGMLLGTFVSGAIMGAVAASTFGVGLLAGGGLRAAGTLAVTSGAASAVGQVTENAVDGDPLDQDVARSAAIGAATAPLGYTCSRAAEAVLPAVSPVASRLPDITRRLVLPLPDPEPTPVPSDAPKAGLPLPLLPSHGQPPRQPEIRMPPPSPVPSLTASPPAPPRPSETTGIVGALSGDAGP